MDSRNPPAYPNPTEFERRARRTVARRLRKCRQARKITQTALAKHVGVTYQQIQKYETGRDRLSIERLMLIAEILDIPIGGLLFGTSRSSQSSLEGSQSLSLTCDGTESLELFDGDIVIEGTGFTTIRTAS